MSIENVRTLRRPGESLPLRFDSAEDSAWFFSMYRDEETVRTNLPALYSAWQKAAVKAPPAEPKASCFADGSGIGRIDWYPDQKRLVVRALSSLTEPAAFTDEILEAHTPSGILVGRMHNISGDTRHTELELAVPCDPEHPDSDYLELDYTVIWAKGSDNTLHGIRSSRNVSLESLLSGSVKEIHLIAPVKKKAGKAAPINICYNRKPVAQEDIDYEYSESWDPKTKLQRLYVPLSAWVEFTDNTDPFDAIDITTFELKLDCQHGVARYTTAGRETRIPERFTAQPDKTAAHPNGFTFELAPDWMEDVPSSRLPVRDRVDLYFRVEFLYKSGKRGSVEISSTLPDPHSVNQVKCDWLNILWGCLAAGTPVRMADGSQRAIEEIRTGDKVLSGDGVPVTVADVFTGKEPALTVLQTGDGLTLTCTASHPVYTGHGVLQAGKITGDCKILGEDGKEHALTGIWNLSGDQKVYSLMLDGGHSFFAGGVLVGDHLKQAETQRRRVLRAAVNPFAGEADVKRRIWGESV